MASLGSNAPGEAVAACQGDLPTRPPPKVTGDGRTWAAVAKGTARPPMWTQDQISEEEVEALKLRFTDEVEIPAEEGELARAAWRDTAVIVRSMGRRVPVEWIRRELRVVGKLDYDVEAFMMANETFAFRFRTVNEREAVMEAGPWLVAGQLLAMERWRPNFVPGEKQLNRLVVWLRLPNLPMEYWTKRLILNIAAKAGRPLALDKITDHGWMLGFARVKVELDAREPIRPGTFVRIGTDVHWQTFRYENLPIFCYRCARLGHGVDACPYPPEPVVSGASGDCIAQQALAPESKEGVEAGSQLPFGSWLSTTRIRQPRASKPVKKTTGSEDTALKETTHLAPESGPSSPRRTPGSPESPMDTEGWQKPTKLARRRSPGKGAAGDSVVTSGEPIQIGAVTESAPSPLRAKGQNLGLERPAHQVGPGSVRGQGCSPMKRARSPTKSGLSLGAGNAV
ncbi:uncharacterized protein LOC120108252 [Phoenix dactylifera]|uniref:Uncharacterized protein LOC120108252 n=1 Tax=Phoenix dactylifera TaxID=42345 RepID=A0A8B9A321_PHODC|nr:uncharacterized protein LOC120108252 [Phoenix dactylifera]